MNSAFLNYLQKGGFESMEFAVSKSPTFVSRDARVVVHIGM